MKTTKLLVNLFLIIGLFASMIVADEGQINGGGRQACNPAVETCPTSAPVAEPESEPVEDSIEDFMKEYIESYFANLLGY